MSTCIDPFIPVVVNEKLDPSFKILMENVGHVPARGIIRELFESFVDPDGNFIEQFQTTGFDARIWEFYLYAYLINSGFDIDRRYSRPDFIATRNQVSICIEAVTANPTSGHQNRESQFTDEKTEFEAICYNQEHLLPIKLGSTLYSKLQRKYWELDHVAGKPLVFAIEDFHEERSLAYTSTSLSGYLYGYGRDWRWHSDGTPDIHFVPVSSHRHESKVIPSAFFSQPGAEYVSAILFSNSGTLSKFNRMGHLSKYHSPAVRMVRQGTCYDHDSEHGLPMIFSYEVGDPNFPESWGQGLTVCYNPNARYTIPQDIFPDAAQITFVDGMLGAKVPRFHPFGSITLVFYRQPS